LFHPGSHCPNANPLAESRRGEHPTRNFSLKFFPETADKYHALGLGNDPDRLLRLAEPPEHAEAPQDRHAAHGQLSGTCRPDDAHGCHSAHTLYRWHCIMTHHSNTFTAPCLADSGDDQDLAPLPATPSTGTALSPRKHATTSLGPVRRRFLLPRNRTACLGWVALFGSLFPGLAQAADAGTLAATVPAKDKLTSTNAFQKPVWLTDLSLSVKESYDNNVFLSGVDPKFYPPAYVVPPGSVAALKNLGSWVTTVTPKIGFNFAPLLGVNGLETLSLCYAPDFSIYHDESSESNEAHRLASAIKGKADSFSYSVENSFSYIDGDENAPTYPGGFITAYGIGAPRERREQFQDRAKAVLRYDVDKWFFRPAASFLYYDMRTIQRDIPGYLNFPDRYDVNGGLDVGYKVLPQLATTLGYRFGHQYQEQFAFSPFSSPSDYHRVLIGLEGKPWKWLKFEIQGGPDFRQYAPDTATHITPLADKNPVKYYGEATLTSEITSRDTLVFKYRQFQWVSSTGKIPYFDSLWDLCYRRKVMTGLTFDLGGRLLSADYNGASVVTCLRTDWQYTVTTGLTYAFNTHLSANLAYALDLGRNMQADLVNPETREYNRHLVSLGATVKF
jgi:hypothetical protein